MPSRRSSADFGVSSLSVRCLACLLVNGWHNSVAGAQTVRSATRSAVVTNDLAQLSDEGGVASKVEAHVPDGRLGQ